MSMNDMIADLLDQDVIDGDKIVFTSTAMEMIHNIALECEKLQIVQKTKEEAEAYAKDLTAEEVYLDMLNKIVEAPTKIHMIMSAKMLIPIIDKKIQENISKGNE